MKIKKIRQLIRTEIRGTGSCRSFRGDKPMNLDEIKAKATMALH